MKKREANKFKCDTKQEWYSKRNKSVMRWAHEKSVECWALIGLMWIARGGSSRGDYAVV